MKTYISYFDHLGFKDFIERNDFETQRRGYFNILRDIENAAAGGKTKKGRFGVIADLSEVSVNILNFSDTILFWTQDDSPESLQELLKITFDYNWGASTFFFPARGAIAYGEIEPIDFKQTNPKGGVYSISSIFGKGLVDVYQKAESTDWSGAVVDSSIIERIIEIGEEPSTFLDEYAKIYQVPYKGGERIEEYAFKLVHEPINQDAFKNVAESIERNFASYNKRIDSEGVQRKIKNTIEFLESSVE